MTETKGLYKLNFDCGRSGSLEGLFVANVEDVKFLIDVGWEVYFGEVLGKHSEVCGPIEEVDIKLISTDDAVIKIVTEHELENGHNPFHYSVGKPNLGDDYNDLTVIEAINKFRAV
jgi:hypothetical protein